MKDYKKVAEDVFRRRDEVIAENKIRRKRVVEICASAACWVAVAAVGFGIWKTNIHGKNIETVDSQPGTSQEANISLPNSEPLSDNTSNMNNINEFIVDGVDIRCLPRHSNVAIFHHTRIDHFDIEEIPDGIHTFDQGTMIEGEWIHTAQKGTKQLSRSLREAIAEYGSTDEYGDIQYDVIIELYRGNMRVNPTMGLFESECERFGTNFYFEKDSQTKKCYLGLAATLETLENLTLSEDYCYIFRLRGNYLNDTDTSSNTRVYNHGDHTALFELEGADFCHPRGTVKNIDAEITEPEYSPDNGTVLFSESLKKAIEKYGKTDKNGELYYEAVFEYYKDGERIDSTKELWEEESVRGVRVSFGSKSDDWGENWVHWIWSTKTVNELENFKPTGDYGIVIYLFDPYFGYPFKYDDNIINGLYNNGVFF